MESDLTERSSFTALRVEDRRFYDLSKSSYDFYVKGSVYLLDTMESASRHLNAIHIEIM